MAISSSAALWKCVTVLPLAWLLVSSPAGAEPPGKPLPAQPGDFALKVEPGLALPLTAPQSELFDAGVSETLKVLWTLNPYLDLGPSVTYLALPHETDADEFGTAVTLGASARFKRPHHAPDNDDFYAISPWVDADALYVRTGGLDRPGFALAAGLSVPVGDARSFWVGPFVRYLHILQGQRSGFDSADAKILSIGISLEVGSGVEREREPVAVTEVVRTVEKVTIVCPDRDEDGIPDSVDACPDTAGVVESRGCRAYQKVVVKKDKLELKDKLYFAWNQATLDEESFPTLDEVVQALQDNQSFRVEIEGHASSEGAYDHNQELSEQRAEAVLDYLAAHGVAKERLGSRGFSSSIPIDTNNTPSGRENNRRVEFVVHFAILE